MTYLRLREPAAGTAIGGRPASAADLAGGFGHDEWKVIALARQDKLASLREPSRLARLFAWFSGGDANRSLANPRLEALRRFAVLAWHHGYTLPVSAIKAFKEAGFSLDQVELLLASVAVGRTREGRRA